MPKVKDREKLKSSKKKGVNYKGAVIRLSADSSTEILEVRKGWHEIVKVMKSEDLQPRLLYPAKLSFRIKEIKCFSDKKKLKEFTTTKPIL